MLLKAQVPYMLNLVLLKFSDSFLKSNQLHI